MAGPHESLEHAEHAEHAAHEGGHNKQIALIISVLALFLAFSETFGKSAQTAALNFQIEASNLWNFFQAKNIRRTVTIVATEGAKVDQTLATDDARKAALAKQIDEWTKTAARYTGFSLGYQLATVFAGAVAPIVGVALLDRFHSTVPVSIYAAAMALPALLSLWWVRETRGADLSRVV